jgi:hypothetical protein
MNTKRYLLVLVSVVLLLAMFLPQVTTANGPDGPTPNAPCRFRLTVQADGDWVPNGTVVTAQIRDAAATWIGYTFTPDPPDPYAGQSVCVLDVPPDNLQTTIKDGGLDGDVVRFLVRWNDIDVPVSQTAVWELGMFVPPVSLPPLNLTVQIGAPVATLSGQPTGWVNYNTATINVDGPNVEQYKYKLDNGAWSAEFSISVPIVLTGLSEVWHTLYVIGGNDAGWQSQDSATEASWGVDMTAPPAPTLISPIGGVRISDTTPIFNWTAVTDPRGVTYSLQIDDNADFSSTVLDKTGLTNNVYTLLDADALQLGGYHWRVKAVDGAGNESDWSTEEFFIVEGAVETPLLVSPPNGTITNDNTPTFTWSCSISGTPGVSFILEIGNSNFSTVSLHQENITGLTYALTTALADGTYYWHVKTVMDGQQSGWTDAWSITIDTTPPTATILNAPTGTVPYCSADITIDGDDVVAYKYKLDDGTWSAEILVATHIIWSCADNPLSDGQHTLYVIGRDTAGNWQLEDNATTASWTVATPEPVAILSSQPTGITSVKNAYIDVGGQDEYGQEVVSFKYKLDAGAWSDEIAAGPDAIMLTSLSDGLHTVYVIGKNCAGHWQAGANATTASWTVDTTAPPAPTLLGPANNSKTNQNTVTLHWSAVSDPSGVSYEVQYDTHSDFSLPAVIFLLDETTYTTIALADGTYYWRVKAWDGASPANEGEWSTVFSFTIDTAAPAAPSLISPKDKAKTRDSTPEFQWSPVTDPSGVTYVLQIADNENFTSLELQISGLTVTSHTVTEKLDSGKHYWRVKAVDGAGNSSPWSGTWSFKVTKAGWWWIILMAVILAAALVAVLTIVQRRRRSKLKELAK